MRIGPAAIIRTLALVVLPAVALAGARPAGAGEIKIAFTIADDIFLAPVFAAEKLGYYKSNDVVIKRLNLRGASQILEALKATQTDIIDMSGPAAAQAFPAGKGGRIVATAGNGFYGWTVIAPSASGVHRMGGLAGKKLGVSSTHSLSDLAGTLAAAQTKVSFQIEAVGAGALVPAMREGKVAAVLSSALVGLREVSAGRAHIVLDLGVDRRPYLVSGFVASEDLMTKRPKDVRGFLAGTFQALAYMKSNRKWSIDLLKEYARISDTGYAERLYDNVVRAMSADAAVDPASLKAVLELASRAWNEPELAKIDPARLFTNEFVTTAP